MAARYTRRHRTDVRRTRKGLWPMASEPGPSFRWGVLTRRSKYNPDGTEGSTRRQEVAICEYIRANDLGQVVATYSDIASAYQEGAKRPEFEAALSDLKAGRIDGIAVWKIDRLVRRVSQYRRVFDILETSGGRLLSMVEGIDTADPERKAINGLILDLLVRLAEMESEGTSERLILMNQDRARQGKRSGGGTRPFGHTLDWFALVPEEAAAIRSAAQRILGGEGVYSITQDWNRNGPRPVRAERWTPTVLSQMLLSPRLIAKRDYDGGLFALEDVPPILDEAIWERVGTILGEVRPNAPKVRHLLSGLAHCGRCERPLRGGRGSSARGSKAIYVCPPKSASIGACGSLSVMADPVNECIEAKVIEWLSERGNVTDLLARCAPGPETEAKTLRIAELNDALVDLSRALKERKIRYADYSKLYDETVEERQLLQRQVAVTREASLLAETLAFEDVAEEWNARPLEWRRAIIKLCTNRIVVEPVGKTTGAQKGRSGFALDPERVQITFEGTEA
jgi:site-specific DNA recombinase